MDDKNFFRELRKKLLADLVVKQSKELEAMKPLLAGGLLPDSRDFYILKRKLGENEKKLAEL
jgi:hypothetical protein